MIKNRLLSRQILAGTVSVILLLAIAPSLSSVYATPPLKELCIALDSSGSITSANWNGVIKPGTVASLQDPVVKAGIFAQMARLSLVTFGAVATTAIAAGDINNQGELDTFTGLILAPIPFAGGGTNMQGAILLCQNEMAFQAGADQVINIVTDGMPTVSNPSCSNSGSFPTDCDQQTLDQATAARALGVDTINILAIGSQVDPAFNAAITAAGGQVFTAATLSDFQAAFTAKLMVELTPTQIAGEILSIDTSALLISGVFANALWILPTLAATGIAGTAFYLVRSRWNKKTEE